MSLDLSKINKCPDCGGDLSRDIGRIHCKTGFPIFCSFSRNIDTVSVEISDLVIGFFDIETTGFSVKTDAITQIAHRVVKGEDTLAKYDTLVHPYNGKTIPKNIQVKTGITNNMLIDAPSLKDSLTSFFDSMTIDGQLPDLLCAHNASFDVRHINASLEHRGLSLSLPPVVDTLKMARVALPNGIVPNHRQETLAEYFGISYDMGDGSHAHMADADVYVLAKLLPFLIELLPEGDNIYNYVYKPKK